MMRIAYFTDTYLPQINGVTNTLGKLGGYLSSHNIKHKFFAPEYAQSQKVNNDSPVKRFRSISFPLYPECRLSIPLYHKMCAEVDKFNPDIIHLMTPLGIGFMGLRYANEKGIPAVSSFTTNFDSYLKYYKLEFFEELVWSYFKWFHANCKANFCPSNETLNVLKGKGIENLRIMTRGIDTAMFNPERRNQEFRKKFNTGDKLLFLYVGRIALEKDLDIMVDSINEINSMHPDAAQFVFVGDGPYTSVIKEKAPNNVFTTGYLKGKELAEAYASCDVFAFPSGTETLGNVVLEAMASGLPVIAVNSGGVKDNVKDGYNGIMCEYRSVNSFTSAISRFITDKELIKQLGENARDYTMKKSWESVFEQLLIDYEDIIGNNFCHYIKSA